MKVAVTGGSGQLGSVVLRKLIDDRAVKRILSLDLRPPSLVSGKLTAIEADVRDPELGRHLEGLDAIVHLAFVVTRRMAHDEMAQINVEGSQNVFRAALARGLRTLIYSSSIAAYGVLPGRKLPISEEDERRYQPEFPYAAHKYLVEEFLDGLEREHPQTRIVRFRPSILIGARMQNPLARVFSRALARGYFPDTSGAPLAVVWDEDVADAILLALKKEVRGAFNVGADDPLPAPELARALGVKLVHIPPAGVAALSVLSRLGIGGEAIDPSWQKANDVEMDVTSEKAKRELGWKPRYPTALEVFRHFVDIVPGRTDVRINTFFRMVGLGAKRMLEGDDQQLRGVTARLHLCLTGKGGGDFGIIIENTAIRIERGIPSPPSSVATMPAALWLDLLAGRANLPAAQFTGKVRIEGDPLAAFTLGGIISRYKRMTETPGVSGFAARALSRWMNGGTP